MRVTRDTNVCDEPVVPVTLLLFSRLKPDCPEMASKIPPAEIDAGSQGDTFRLLVGGWADIDQRQAAFLSISNLADDDLNAATILAAVDLRRSAQPLSSSALAADTRAAAGAALSRRRLSACGWPARSVPAPTISPSW